MHKEALTEKGKELFPQLREFPELYLAGGTALALQIGHRVSVDFDLFTEEEIPKNLLKKVEKVFGNSTILILANNPEELSVSVDGVKISFIQYPFPLVRNACRYKGLRLMDKKEIAASKAYTIGRRGEYKDYVDIYFLLLGKHTTLKEMMQLARDKYKNEFNDRLFLEQLVYADDIYPAGIVLLKGKNISVNEVTGFFEKEITCYGIDENV